MVSVFLDLRSSYAFLTVEDVTIPKVQGKQNAPKGRKMFPKFNEHCKSVVLHLRGMLKSSGYPGL